MVAELLIEVNLLCLPALRLEHLVLIEHDRRLSAVGLPGVVRPPVGPSRAAMLRLDSSSLPLQKGALSCTCIVCTVS